jgi:hypothetical protein
MRNFYCSDSVSLGFYFFPGSNRHYFEFLFKQFVKRLLEILIGSNANSGMKITFEVNKRSVFITAQARKFHNFGIWYAREWKKMRQFTQLTQKCFHLGVEGHGAGMVNFKLYCFFKCSYI